jgi:hypothetical protein
MTEKVFQVTGAALKPLRGGRRGTRKNRNQEGGDNSGALLQLQGQSVSGTVSSQAQNMAAAAASATANAMKQLGPIAIQKGGDNSGGLMQLASVPNISGPMDTQQFAATFRNQVGQILNNNFGPDKAQQFGGKKGRQHGGDVTAGAIEMAANRAPTTPGAPAPTPIVSGVAPSQPAPVGGARRLVLAPPKRKTRIALKAKKMRGGSDSGGPSAAGLTPELAKLFGGATRKARKIHLRVKGVTSRLAKAKKAKKVAESASISTIRSKLESSGVIKKGSKAPEKMLRTMYADLMITKSGL